MDALQKTQGNETTGKRMFFQMDLSLENKFLR